MRARRFGRRVRGLRAPVGGRDDLTGTALGHTRSVGGPIERAHIGRLATRLIAVLTVFAASVVTDARAAEPLTLRDSTGEYPLAGYVEVLEDPEWRWTIDDVSSGELSGQFVRQTRLERLKRFFAPEVAELVAGGHEEMLRPHRRKVTVLCARLIGFPRFTETAEPEEVMAVLDEHHGEMGRLILDHGGTLERFATETLTVFFNDPIEIPDAERRALRLAIAMRDVVEILATRWTGRGWDLGLGVGIANGYATLGVMGFEKRCDYGVVGAVTQQAEALAAAARPGGVVVSERVLAAAGGHLAAERAGEIAIEGARRPVVAWRIASPNGSEAKARSLDAVDGRTSIESVATSVESKRPDLGAVGIDGTVTILFSDMEGFSRMTERLGDREAHKVIQAHNSIVRAELRAHSGLEVELQGDGFLLAFGSARRALSCAVAIQAAFAAHNAKTRERAIRVRIGAHCGEPIKEGDRFFGKTLILAARIASQAGGGEILVSSLVKELVESTGDFAFEAVPDAELKGLAGTHRIHRVVWQEVDEQASPPPVAPSEGNGVRHEGEDSDGALFRRDGDYWSIRWKGAEFRLKDSKGLHYIAHLLRHRGQEFQALDLATTIVSSDGAGMAVQRGDGEAPQGIDDDSGPILDTQAKAAYRRRLADLREELEEAESFNDTGRVEKIRTEIEAITRELSAAVGLGGRDRRAGSNAERARLRVTVAIRTALRRIAENDAALGDHLSLVVRTGTFCSYAPVAGAPASWSL